MNNGLIVSVSGVRGIFGQSLTGNVVAGYASVFAGFLKQKNPGDENIRVCIGRDSRPSGGELSEAFASRLCLEGIDVVDLGIASTPGVGVMTRHLGCAGGVVITASHNPLPYNGIKLLLAGGCAPPLAVATQIKQVFLDGLSGGFKAAAPGHRGRLAVDQSTCSVHVGKVLSTVDRDSIGSRKYRVVLDSVNGAGGPIGKMLLRELSCDVVAVNDQPTGIFAHEPEPLAANLVGLCQRVRAAGADVGFAQDPDADRLAIVDENGVYIGEEYTLVMAAMSVFRGRTGSAATNLSTSRMIDDVAGRFGCRVHRVPVGEAHVAESMLKHDCIIGGEGNGGVIDPRVGYVRDSICGMALILDLMAATGSGISALTEQIGGYAMIKDKFAFDASQTARLMDLAMKAFPGAGVNTADGLRLDFEDGWVSLRSSNTEPVMRVIVEARDRKLAEDYIARIKSLSLK